MDTIVVTSGVGGAGKSLLTAGLALALHRLERSVAVIETGRRTLDVLLGCSPVFDCNDLLSAQNPFTHIALQPLQGLLVVPGALSTQTAAYTRDDQIAAALRCLHQLPHLLSPPDFLIWEIPCHETLLLRALAPQSLLTLLVCGPDAAAARENRRLSDDLFRFGVDSPGLYVTPLPPDFLRLRPIPDLDWLIDQVCAQLWGILPYTPHLLSPAPLPQSFFRYDHISQPFLRLAARIMGKYIDLWIS